MTMFNISKVVGYGGVYAPRFAHLSDFDHSQAFHNRCDSYCRTIIGREERILEAELKRELRRLKC